MRISILKNCDSKKIKKAKKQFNISRAVEYDGECNIRNVEMIDEHGTIFRGFGKTRKSAIKHAYQTLKNRIKFSA